MQKLGIWTNSFIEALKSADGDVSILDSSLIPEELKENYKTAFNQDQFNLVDCAAARQKWIGYGTIT